MSESSLLDSSNQTTKKKENIENEELWGIFNPLMSLRGAFVLAGEMLRDEVEVCDFGVLGRGYRVVGDGRMRAALVSLFEFILHILFFSQMKVNLNS